MAKQRRMTHSEFEVLRVQDFDRLEAENARLRKALEQAMVELRIYKSVIQCGEPWSTTLQESYVIMREEYDAASATDQEGGKG